MVKEIRHTYDAHTDIFSKVGLIDDEVVPFCGQEVHRNHKGEDVISFDCYAVNLIELNKFIGRARPSIALIDNSTILLKNDKNITLKRDDLGKCINIHPYPHRASDTDLESIKSRMPSYRYYVFNTPKRKYQPTHTDERLREGVDTKIALNFDGAHEAFRLTRAMVASMLREQGITGVEADFLMINHFNDDWNHVWLCTGMAMAVGDSYFTTFLHALSDGDFALATQCELDGKELLTWKKFTNTDSAEDILRHLSGVLLGVAKSTAARQRIPRVSWESPHMG